MITILGCNKNNDIPEVEPWKTVFPAITEKIFDARVNGEELHLISDSFFYRIHGDIVLEKRTLENTYYHNYSQPIIGRSLFFRLINFDTVAYLEFQPIKPGGNVKRISYSEFGDDKLTFPISHGFAARHNGRFDDQNHFLFAGFDYPSLQQFISYLEIDYDSISNNINGINIIERQDLNPVFGFDEQYRVEDVFETDGIFFLNVGYGGHYRYTPGFLNYNPTTTLYSIIKEESGYYSSDLSRRIIQSSDLGTSWVATPFSLNHGWVLLKEGDYFIETNEYGQLFRVGKKLDELISFSFPPYGDVPFTYADIKYYAGRYLIFVSIEGKNQIFSRSTLQ